jgi:signal peptidase I
VDQAATHGTEAGRQEQEREGDEAAPLTPGRPGGPDLIDGVHDVNGVDGVADGETGPTDTDADAGTEQVQEEPRPRSFAGRLGVPFVWVYRLAFPKKPRPFLVELPFLLVIALFLAFLIKTFLIQAFVIPSGSMQNTLALQDRVVVNRFSTWLGSEPRRGEIVVFKDPGGWLQGESTTSSSNVVSKVLTFIGVLPQDNGDLIKRVIGVPGDVVKCDASGKLSVNGVVLNEPYLFPGDNSCSGPGGVPSTFTVTVRPGQLWVMGDHRSVSEDSRAHMTINGGQVPEGDVVGQAFAIVWPTSQWQWLSVPGTFGQNFGVGAAAVLPLGVLRQRRRRRVLRDRDAEDS